MKKMLLFMGILCFIIFSFFYYKTLKNGNNISNKSQEEVIDYILNDMKEYKANLEVTVISNKTEKIYTMKQEVTQEKSMQEIISPENIKGIKMELSGNSLKILNTELNLEKIYEQYEPIFTNSLFLNVFVKDYKENVSKSYEIDDEIVLETELQNTNNTYAQYKELHFDKNSKKITKLIIKDNTKKVRVSIKYNDIEIK